MKVQNFYSDLNSMFNWFIPFGYKRTFSSNSVSGNDVSMGQGLTYVAKTNGLSIHGNQGVESVVVSPNVTDIKIDNAVESVTLTNVAYDPSLLNFSESNVVVNTVSGSTIVSLAVLANHREFLNFSNASGFLTIDNSGKAAFNLSEILLDKNQNYVVNVNNLSVYGNSGTESITIQKDVSGIQVASSIENVIFSGQSTDYAYRVVGNTVLVSNKTSGSNIAGIFVNTASDGTQLHFSDKTITAVWDYGLTSDGGWTGRHWGVSLIDPSIQVPSTTISGGTNLKYAVDFSHANLGSNLANVEANIKTALDNIGQYISSKVVFNLDVFTEKTTPKILAETSATMVGTTAANGVTQTTKFLADSATGIESSPNTADASLYINLAMLNQMSFSNAPVSDKYNLTSILTHEILHGLAFTGNLDQGQGSAKTPFDALVSNINGSPVFVGAHAESVYGNTAVPLEPISAGPGSSYYHVAVANDLMSDAIGKGEVRTISSLDVAMLQDLGLSIVGVPNSLLA